MVRFPQAPHQGEELLVGVVQPGVFQVDVVDGLGDLPGQPRGQHPREDQGQYHNPKNGLQHTDYQGAHGGLLAGQPQNGAVIQAHGIVEGLLQEGVGEVLALPGPLLQGLDDLPPVGVVFHGGGVCLAVIEDSAVRRDPGQALAALQVFQAGEIVASALLHAALDIDGGLLHLLVDLVLVAGGHHCHKQRGTQYHDRQPHQETAAKDFPRHAWPPILYPTPRTVSI